MLLSFLPGPAPVRTVAITHMTTTDPIKTKAVSCISLRNIFIGGYFSL